MGTNNDKGGPVVLGEEYRDTHTGFVGIATARTTFLYGCVRVQLEANTLKEDKSPNEAGFDEQRLVSTKTDEPVKTTATTGGNQPLVARATSPVR